MIWTSSDPQKLHHENDSTTNHAVYPTVVGSSPDFWEKIQKAAIFWERAGAFARENGLILRQQQWVFDLGVSMLGESLAAAANFLSACATNT